MPANVADLSSRKARLPSLAGGKGFGLALLARSGFPVPPGFVITTHAFREVLSSAFRLAAPGSHSGDGHEPFLDGGTLERARRHCLAWTPPAALKKAVSSARRRLEGPVAVRSSLVGEDAAGASHAGLLETVLDVGDGPELLDAIRRVLASAFGDRLWSYKNLCPASAPPRLAVVVQPMVRAAASGVAFSVDPVTGRPGVVIEAVPGTGEALVRGRALPDRYRLDPRGEVEEIVPARAGAPALDEAAILKLGGIVGDIAVWAGHPQDVEWAFDGQAFHILQARPISSLAGRTIYSRRMVAEMAPGLVKPLVWSTKYRPIVRNVFGPMFERLAGPTGIDPERLSARIHSRVYMNATLFGDLFRRIGLPPNFFETLARDDKAARGRVRFRLRMLPAGVRLARFAWRESRGGRRVGRFLEDRRRDLEAFRFADWAGQTFGALIESAGRLQALHGETQWHVVTVTLDLLVRSRLLARMIARRRPGTDPRDVIKGYGRRSSLAPFEAIRGMGEGARRLDPRLIERMAGDGGFDPEGELTASDGGRALLDRFREFMGRYGFLSANGSDFSEVPWIEDPRLIWRTVGRLALAEAPPSADGAPAHREQVLALVRAGLGPVRRRVFDRLQASTVRAMERREGVSLLMTEESYLMRRCFLTLGARLAGSGTLAAAEDVFYLYGDELEAAAFRPEEAASIAEKVAARKREMAEDESVDAPDTLRADDLRRPERPTAEGRAFLSGIGASAGVRTGWARVVHGPALEGGRFGPSDILVVPFTDIGWAPILAGVGGVVADTGGQLSHTSIIAREFGIPAVVSVRNATRLIRDGRSITVDGRAGRVYLHPEDGS